MVRKGLSLKERETLKSYVETQSMDKTGAIVRTKCGNSTNRGYTSEVVGKSNIVSRLEQVFDAVGLDEHSIAQKLKDKTDAKRTVFFAHDGIVTEVREVEDNQVQLKAVEIAAKLRGMDIHRSANFNVHMTADDIRSLKSDDLQKLIRQCDTELKTLEGTAV